MARTSTGRSERAGGAELEDRAQEAAGAPVVEALLQVRWATVDEIIFHGERLIGRRLSPLDHGSGGRERGVEALLGPESGARSGLRSRLPSTIRTKTASYHQQRPRRAAPSRRASSVRQRAHSSARATTAARQRERPARPARSCRPMYSRPNGEPRRWRNLHIEIERQRCGGRPGRRVCETDLRDRLSLARPTDHLRKQQREHLTDTCAHDRDREQRSDPTSGPVGRRRRAPSSETDG